MSKESLLQTMREVVEMHGQRAASGVVSATHSRDVQPATGQRFTPEDIRLLRQNHRGCIHCHHVREYGMLQAGKDAEFDRQLLFPFPLPENIGLRFDVRHGHRIEQVLPGSAAAESALRTGDVITLLNDVPIHSEYDFRWALGKAPESGPLDLTALRTLDDGTVMKLEAQLAPRADWRSTDLSWRRSLRSVPFPFGFGGFILRQGFAQKELAVRVTSVYGKGMAKDIGLENDDIIVALGGQTQPRTFEQFQSDLLCLYQPGDTVELTVLRSGKRVELRGKLPDWSREPHIIP
jgi:S1-C subfamily serine protease